MAPLADALARLPDARHRVLLTGQHAGLGGRFTNSDVGSLGIDLVGFSPAAMCDALRQAIRGVLGDLRPALVLVHGDTTSALGGALAAHDLGIDCGHVEAGLRSFDERYPWPEEGNRKLIDRLSQLLFAPTDLAASNLAADPAAKGEVYITGNTGIDALFEACRALGPVTREEGLILVTCHRRENQSDRLVGVVDALKRLADELPVRLVFALHPNPHIRARTAAALSGSGVTLLEPQGYEEMVALLARAWAVLTDSGGLQEECAALGVPCLVLRDVTERREAGDQIELVGTEPGRIVGAVTALLADPDRHGRMSRPSLAFGDGHAAARIAGLCAQWLRSAGARQTVDEAQTHLVDHQKGRTEIIFDTPAHLRAHEAEAGQIDPDDVALLERAGALAHEAAGRQVDDLNA